jgi:hypothetical protein
MAFGKKGKDQGATGAVPPMVAEVAEEELSEALFGTEGPEVEDGATTADPVVAEETEAPADPLSTDLLNMFQTMQVEQEDLSVVLDLAGDVDLDDLLEDLHTVAAALGCNVTEDAYAA